LEEKMKNNKAMLAAIAGVGLVVSTAEAAVVYRETFPNAGPGAQSLAVAGWEARVRAEDGNSAFATSGFASFNSSDSNALGNTDAPLNSNPQSTSLTNGTVVNFFGGNFWLQPTLYYTNEYTLDRSVFVLDSISWFQNAQSGASNGFRAAVEIGGQWYVNETTYVGFLSPTVNAAGSTWLNLAFSNLAVSGSPGALPDGDITGFGLFTDRSGLPAQFEEFDNFAISATVIPEPVPAPGILAGMALLSSRFMCRRR
jgi:hypothetical protein